MRFNFRLYPSSLCLIAFYGLSFTSINTHSDEAVHSKPSGIYEEVLVTGGEEKIETLSGSAALINEEAIKLFDTTDLNDLLTQVPGVYIRQEDGFGLRPNIGLRGTNSDRSAKITFLEDGILIGPAPYSAPAAYYVPNVPRVAAVEVFKGPAVVRHGPHSVGGAINFVTKPVPEFEQGEINLAGGSDGFEKYAVSYGNNFDNFGFLVDALRFGSDGFKELDGGGDTGFERNDFNAKLQWRTDADAPIYQELEVKLGFADEDADETYLGLTDEDFAINPNRRYISSQLDRFVSEHSQVHLLHTADFRNDWKVISRAYVNQFERSWDKFDGLITPNFIDAADVLNGNLFNGDDLLALIRGERTSQSDTDLIDVTNNQREFESSGVEVEVQYVLETDVLTHNISTGLLYHNDWVERDHSQRGFRVVGPEGNRSLEFDGNENRPNKALNRGEVDALAYFLKDEIYYGAFTINLGFRYENIESEFVERALGREADISDSFDVFLPSAGVFYEATKNLGFLFGVNKGFSPKAASSGSNVESEESINYEYGFRYNYNTFDANVIGFFSDYSNLLGRCRASDTGCNVGDEFGGGEAEVKGVEANIAYTHNFANGWQLPFSVNYTYTDARFGENFESSFTQWGIVESGDVLPYVPFNQANLQIGLQTLKWLTTLSFNYVGSMREASGRSGGAINIPLEGEVTDELAIFNLSIKYDFSDSFKFDFIIDNVADEQKIVSRRPFAARPNQPRTVKVGVNYHF